MWVAVVGEGSWAKCYGPFDNYDACCDWLRANGWSLPEAKVHPVHAPTDAMRSEQEER